MVSDMASDSELPFNTIFLVFLLNIFTICPNLRYSKNSRVVQVTLKNDLILRSRIFNLHVSTTKKTKPKDRPKTPPKSITNPSKIDARIHPKSLQNRYHIHYTCLSLCSFTFNELLITFWSTRLMLLSSKTIEKQFVFNVFVCSLSFHRW